MAFITIDTSYEPSEVISLQLVKKQLKIEPEDIEEDDLIRSHIESAVCYAENYTGSVLAKKQFLVSAKGFEQLAGFQRQKLLEIVSIVYQDTQGVQKTLSDDLYRIESISKLENQLVFQNDLPEVEPYNYKAVTMQVLLGYEKLPKAITQAILLLVTDFHTYRSDRKKDSLTSAHNLLAPYKIHF